MEAATWTVIGILAAALFGLGTLFLAAYQHLGSRIDDLGTELRSVIQEQTRELRTLIESQTAELRSRLDRHIDMHP